MKDLINKDFIHLYNGYLGKNRLKENDSVFINNIYLLKK